MQQAETSVDVLHPRWVHRAVATAERLAVHPAALQLRRLSEAPELLDDIVLAHALDVTHARTTTALLSPSLRHQRRHALLRVHAELVAQLPRAGAEARLVEAVTSRIRAEAARAWLDDSARWPQ
ncbi:hypothetical protein QI633_01665 [Nocardioides sp. QY071]|uniref:hypothetical protein n=1 Tax=Nocardioides sp. QY071 TaxID=3044187 RepID=UPI00249A6D52|nr:hypothetical protein [Nocardioides sp. QY071]WGY02474.1 hypothetical protein QI633_01665 [Nocardioides sp. QY071]